MPETVSLRLEEMSEEALKERINLRKVIAAVDLYDQLLQSGEKTHTHFVKAILVTTFIEINHSPDHGTNLRHQNVRTKCVKARHRGFTVLGPDLLKVCVYKSIYKLISDAKKTYKRI